MNLKRNIVICALLVALAAPMVLTGCGKTEPAPTSTTASATAPTPAPTTAPTEPKPLAYPNLITYKEYMDLTGEEQYAYFQTFPTATEFNSWFNGEKAKWEAEQEKEKTDGNITLN